MFTDEVELRFPDAADVELSVREISITEELSRPFRVRLVTLGSDGSVDLERVAGSPAVVRVDRGALGARTFTGVCASIEQRRGVESSEPGETGRADILYRYDVEVVPAIWLLRHRTNQRIFPHLSTPDIVLSLLSEWGVAAESRVTEGAFPKHEYRVQYGESDLDFLTRLLDEAGISYFFEGAGATVVLSDRTEKSDPRSLPFTNRPHEAAAFPHVTDVRVRGATGPGRFTLGDFVLRRPRGGILYRADGGAPGEERLERFAYEPGVGTIDVDGSQDVSTPAADDQSAARTDEEAGYKASTARLAGLRGPLRGVAFGTNVVDLGPGSALLLAGEEVPRLATGAPLVVTRSHIEGSLEGAWRGSSVAVFADGATAGVRPEPSTPSPRRPRIDGLQSAIVVGPPGEEIYTDEFGRVRVCFHWDRSDGPDETRTCWLRVSEGWSGPAFGMIATPRVGNEVVVSFYEGNPDQPMVVGRLHNVVTPTVAALPGAQTRTTWSSNSTPGGGGHHELTFDDQVGRELVLVRSERDLETVIKRELREIAGLDQSIIVGRHLATTIARDDSSIVGQKHEVSIGQIQSMNIGEAGTPAVTPLGTRREIIARRITLTTGGATIELSGPEITITTEQDIHITAGGTVDIQGGPQVHINPPVVGQGGDPSKAGPPPSHVAWFKLLSEDGTPLAGVRCYLEYADGTASQPLVTGGDGTVRLPVDPGGSYQVKMGRPPAPGGS